jgi:hypothetical protein
LILHCPQPYRKYFIHKMFSICPFLISRHVLQ